MKRFMFALGILATIAVSESDAAYLIIRIVLESGNQEPAAAPSSGLGTGSSKGPGIGSAAGLKPPGGGGGPPPGGGPGPGNYPKGGSSGGPPPGSGPGPGGFKGGSSGGPPPGLGGASGALGSPPGLGGGPGTTTHSTSHSDPTRSLYIVVPYTNDITKSAHFYKKAPLQSQNPQWQPAVKHAFGNGNLLFDNTSIQLYFDLGPTASKGVKTRLVELTDKRAKMINVTDGQALLDLVNEAIENGFVTEAMKYTDDLATAVTEKKARSTPQVDRYLAAYAKIKEDITRPARSQSDGPVWKERIGFAYTGVRDHVSQHYHMLYWEGMDAEMNRRVDQLESNFKAFFLVNALRGIVLPVPEKPQIVILAKSTADVRRLSASLDGMPAVADGFYSPDHGIVVLSPERLDAVSQTFNRQIQDMFRAGVGRSQLLAGDGPKLDVNGVVADSKKPEDVARMMTWVVAERFAEEEGEWSAVSREGTRQLLHATGQMPQYVALPQWLSEGSANYYHRAKGPVFSNKDEKDYITVALTTGFNMPNYVRQKQFNELIRLGQFTGKPTDKADPGQIVRNVVTDAYFAAAVAGLDADSPRLPLPPAPPKAASTAPAIGAIAGVQHTHTEEPIVVKRRRAEFLASKAQSTAWSLYYYLARANAAGLERYIAELNAMPRDLPLPEGSRITAFAKAFNLSLDGKRSGEQITIEEFGTAWFQYMSTVASAGVDVPLVDLTAAPAAAGGAGLGDGRPGDPSKPMSK